jgi:hypothetical protein
MADLSRTRTIPMAVHCESDCRVIEQLGEKQHFESELSRLGFTHADFMLLAGVVSSKWSGREHTTIRLQWPT